MKISARGWNRNMGSTEIADIDLSGLLIDRREGNRTVHFNDSGLFAGVYRTWIAWGKSLTLGGNYRFEVEFTSADVLQLFKARFGTQLGPELLEEYGFTATPELERAVLSKIKLTDVTLGDLLKMGGNSDQQTATSEKPVETKTFFRRTLS
jgi:hypothetical protein